ncbi:potassium channel family protein [Pseudovibrio sp. Tun.PSC04-5.I4]|uniref:potassium channel family protein n=1 Tax=Pseudovibrio sp. Tun.PSC04-5.I4 TaxID=1798213 RepID=UPI00088CC952|nr:potassium channel family protein [Pseudovibrio sp. Tun.PSC04-5.I4]SDQ86956.1 Ion channel [Pseudovibrio sp. Tun.PSC04-5.I4]
MVFSQKLESLYKLKVEVFLFSQFILLFGSLVLPGQTLEQHIFSLFYSFNIATGLLITLKKKMFRRIITVLLACSLTLLLLDAPVFPAVDRLVPQIVIYFVFHSIVAVVLIEQMLLTKDENYRVVLGVLSGYISIGMVSFFLFILIEHMSPGSFKGLPVEDVNSHSQEEALMYAAFITLMTIGYGDIVPLTPIARKAAIIVGLAGQFYMVVLTAIIVGKFLKFREPHRKD